MQVQSEQMEVNFGEACAILALFLILVIISNVCIYCLTRKLVVKLALNCESECAQIRSQISSLQKALQTQQNALLRLKKK